MNYENTETRSKLKPTIATSLAAIGLLLAGCGDDDYDSRAYASAEDFEQEEVNEAVREMAPENSEVRDSAEIVLHEERLSVEKKTVPAGGVLISKNVVTEEVDRTVDLRQEQIEVTHLDADEAAKYQNSQDSFDGEFSEEKVFIPVVREEAVAKKTVHAREVVSADKTSQTVSEEVSAELRSEDIEINRVGEKTHRNMDSESEQELARLESVDEETIIAHLKNETEIAEEAIDELDIEVQNETVIISGEEEHEQLAAQIAAELRQVEGIASVDTRF